MLERLNKRQCCVVRVLVERLSPYKGRVYDPCCRSAGMDFLKCKRDALFARVGGRSDVESAYAA